MDNVRPTTPATPDPVGSEMAEAPLDEFAGLLEQIESRVVREQRRQTWFVVNHSDGDLATIPIQLDSQQGIRRVHVNGEVAEFSATESLVLVRPHRPLRMGAGTIVVIHFR